MNQVYYGNQAYGIKAAARAYFGKDITSDDPDDQLTVGEAAMLVGLVRAPSALDPTKEAVERTDDRGRRELVVAETAGARRVQGFVLDNMVTEGYITQAEADEAAAEEIVLAPQRANRYRAPALRVRRAARGGQAARRREPARPRRPPHRYHPAVRRLPAQLPRSGRAWRTTWIGSPTSSWWAATARRRWAGSSSCRAATSTMTRW